MFYFFHSGFELRPKYLKITIKIGKEVGRKLTHARPGSMELQKEGLFTIADAAGGSNKKRTTNNMTTGFTSKSLSKLLYRAALAIVCRGGEGVPFKSQGIEE